MTFTLSPLHARALEALEHESFAGFCAAANVPQHEYEAFLLANLRREWQNAVAALGAAGAIDAETAARMSCHYDYAQTLFEYHHAQIDETRNAIATALPPLSAGLGVHWPYVRRIADEYGVYSASVTNEQLLSVVIREVPCILTWETEINAFVARQSAVGNLPVISVYAQLLGTIDIFVEVVLGEVLTLSSNGALSVVHDDLWEERGAEVSFARLCHQAIEMLLGRATAAAIPTERLLSKQSPQAFMTSRFITHGAGHFVWLHEYGHLLLGHLELPHSPRLEFAADALAFTIIQREFANVEHGGFWVKVGTVVMLVMLHLLELVSPPTAGTHPSSLARLNAVVSRDPDAQRLLWYATAMLHVCGPTLKETYGVAWKRSAAGGA